MSDLSSIPLADLIAEIRRREHSLNPALPAAQIVAAEAAATGLAPAAILGRRRTRRLAAARARCMAALYHLGYSSPEVGRVFSRHHSTVLNALKTTTP